MSQLKINQRYKDLIPPLSEDELRNLEESILAHGCRDAIKTWKNTIIDGHNRYNICAKHSIPFKTTQLRLKSQNDAIVWIIDNQLGRRNLTNAARIDLAAQKVDMLAKENPDGKINVRKATAKIAGVSENTVYKYMKIKKLGSPELVAQVDSGEKKIGAAYAQFMVTTRVVEEWYRNDETPGLNNTSAALGVIGNLGELGDLYRFMLGKAELLCMEEGREVVWKRLARQLRRVEGLVEGLC